MIKLGKALYYRHNYAILDGVIYARHISTLSKDTTPAFLEKILKLAPAMSDARRNNQSLNEQFLYKFNNSIDHGAIYAVVEFSSQFIFQILAISQTLENTLAAKMHQDGQELPTMGRYPCPLKHKPATT